MQEHRSNPRVRREVHRLLNQSDAYQALDAPTRDQLGHAMTSIASVLAEGGQGSGRPVAEQFAPNLQDALAPKKQAPDPPQSAHRPKPGGQAPSGQRGGKGPTGRVGEVARATLNAIDFPSFVASLIQGTFQAIVDASIQQMEAYAELLKNVAATVDTFMDDNISEDAAQDYLADRYPGMLARDISQGAPRLQVNRDHEGSMPSFFKDLGFDSPSDLDEDTMAETVIPAARRTMAEQRQQMLATMVLMGMNRVVVDDGEIAAKLMFHIDASESTEMRFDQTKVTTGNMSGQAGRNPFAAQALMVNTANVNAQSDFNVRADLTGSVKVRFRSETFPLERFADSAAIQLINGNAKVPGSALAPTEQPAEQTPKQQQAPATQSAVDETDPWAP